MDILDFPAAEICHLIHASSLKLLFVLHIWILKKIQKNLQKNIQKFFFCIFFSKFFRIFSCIFIHGPCETRTKQCCLTRLWVQIPARVEIFFFFYPILHKKLRSNHKRIFLIFHILSDLSKKNLLLCSEYRDKNPRNW